MEENKNTIKLTIKNKLGLHARAAATLVKLTNKFNSEIYIEKSGQVVNGKSIMGVMMLAAAKGHEICVTAEGEDSNQALESIKQMVDDRFGEE